MHADNDIRQANAHKVRRERRVRIRERALHMECLESRDLFSAGGLTPAQFDEIARQLAAIGQQVHSLTAQVQKVTTSASSSQVSTTSAASSSAAPVSQATSTYAQTPAPVVELPAAPLLVGPGGSGSPGLTVQGTTQVFQWQQVSIATGYKLNVRDVTTPGNAVQNYVISGGATTSYAMSDLLPGHTYKWNMFSLNSAGQGGVSADRYFTVAPIVAPTPVVELPAAPVLVGPGGSGSPGLTVQGTTQVFQWQQVSNATGYKLNVRDVTTPGNPVQNYVISGGATTSYSLSSLIAGHTYKWNMFSLNSAGQGGVSADRYFTIQDAVSAPSLIGPGSNADSGASLSGGNQTFRWNPVAGATSYLLNVRDVTTNALASYPLNASATSYSLTLTPGHGYRWNMFAYKGSTQSAVSETRYFTIAPVERAAGAAVSSTVDRAMPSSANVWSEAIEAVLPNWLPSGAESVDARSATYRLPLVNSCPGQIREADYEWAAESLQVDIALVKAVAQVESTGSGFLQDGRPRILFEAHRFSKLTAGTYDSTHPTISSPTWSRSLYRGGAAEYERLGEAIRADADAASRSTSWGKFQILGENFKAAGYGSVEAFVEGMFVSERKQLEAFVAFLKASNLQDPLRRHDWAAFANGYNGSGYASNSYDQRLEAAYERIVAVPPALIGPGRQDSPGTTLTDTAATFWWNPVKGAAGYQFYLRDLNTNELVEQRVLSADSTSFTCTLIDGHQYRWNLRTLVGDSVSDISQTLYLQVGIPSKSAETRISTLTTQSPTQNMIPAVPTMANTAEVISTVAQSVAAVPPTQVAEPMVTPRSSLAISQTQRDVPSGASRPLPVVTTPATTLQDATRELDLIARVIAEMTEEVRAISEEVKSVGAMKSLTTANHCALAGAIAPLGSSETILTERMSRGEPVAAEVSEATRGVKGIPLSTPLSQPAATLAAAIPTALDARQNSEPWSSAEVTGLNDPLQFQRASAARSFGEGLRRRREAVVDMIATVDDEQFDNAVDNLNRAGQQIEESSRPFVSDLANGWFRSLLLAPIDKVMGRVGSFLGSVRKVNDVKLFWDLLDGGGLLHPTSTSEELSPK